jgi:hypothetical protein
MNLRRILSVFLLAALAPATCLAATAAGYTIKQSSTAYPLVFFMVDSTDHRTGKTGLTPTVTLRKVGGSFATQAGTVTEIANGWYQVAGNATDSNTLGPLLLHATATGADPTDEVYEVVAFDPQDATPAVDVTQISGDAAAADNAEKFFDGEGYGAHLLIGILDAVNTQTNVTIDLPVNGTMAVDDFKDCRVLFREGSQKGVRRITASGASYGGSSYVDITLDSALPWNLTYAATYTILPPDIRTEDRASLLAVKAKTDSLTFTVAGTVNSNVTHVSSDATAANQLSEIFDNDSIGGDMDLTSLVVNNASGSAVSLTGGGVGGNGLEITGSGTALAISGGGSGNGVSIVGSGSGHGLLIHAGATGNGLYINGGSTSGDAISASTTSGDGMDIRAGGTGDAIFASATNGDGVDIRSTGAGDAIYASATSGDGMDINGGGTTGHGAIFTRGGTSGDDMAFTNADVGVVNDIKAKTDSLTFTVAGAVNSNITFVNGISASPLTPPIDANLTHAGGTAIGATGTGNFRAFFDGTGFGVHPLRTTISSLVGGSQTQFVITAGPETDSSLVGSSIVFRDPTAGESGGPAFSRRTITGYTYASPTRTVTINSAPDFTIGAGDIVEILPP